MTLSNNKRKVVLGGLVVAGMVALSTGLAWALRAGSDQSTSDAVVAADFTVVAPRVAGQISELSVEDNQVVHRGDLLAKIDDRDYVAAVAAAEAEVATAHGSLESVAASISQQQAVIEQAAAALTASQARYVFAKADFDRYTDLAAHGAGSTQNAQQARTRIDSARADVLHETAALKAARQQTAVLTGQRVRAEGECRRAQANLDTARLNLSWTRIPAPVGGMVGQRAVRVGAYVTPGTPLLAVVPLEQAYVIANFQETQLADVRPGQAADLRVDTYPGLTLRGTVESLAPATGVTFAAIAPDNATGNFTKVVQRIPVKIVLAPGENRNGRLRVGMSVEATIHARRSAVTDTEMSKVATR